MRCAKVLQLEMVELGCEAHLPDSRDYIIKILMYNGTSYLWRT